METKYSKELYRKLKRTAKEHNIRFFTEDLSNTDGDYNGISIAYVPAIDRLDCRMLEVAVSYCAPEDKFKPKHGKFQVLHKFLVDEKTVHIPLAEFYRDNGAKETEDVLFNMFLV